MDNEGLRRQCRNLAPSLVRWRRHLHAHPELSFQEFETAAFIRRHLTELGIQWTNPAGNSTVAVVPGNRPGRTVALRADIDALPITEENTFDFKSTRSGVMHACGHDGHTAILMGVAQLLAQSHDFPGTIKLLFQEAEEQPPGGAQALIAAGAMADVDHVMGLHLWSDIPAGRAQMLIGNAMAAADRFTARILGKGGHGAAPHQAIDALVIAANFVMNLQTIVARKVNPLQPAVATVGTIRSGFTFNVIAPSAELGGTLRAFDQTTREQLHMELERTLAATCDLYGASYELEIETGYPVLTNHPDEAEVFRTVCAAVLENDSSRENALPSMGGEDFAYYLQERPGAFLFLGCRNPAHAAVWPHHHPRFTIDEDVLPYGVEILTRAAFQLLPG